MEQFMTITKRNLKIYFRDKGTIFFSLLSMLVVICLMMFFLGDMNVESITRILSEFPGRDAAADEKNAELLVLSWTFAGILSINAVTVTLAAYSVMIKDRETGKLNSIYTSPISRTIITAGYVAAAWLASVCVCLLTLTVTEIYGIIKGLEWFSFATHIKLIGMIMVNSFVYAALMYVLAMLAKTEGGVERTWNCDWYFGGISWRNLYPDWCTFRGDWKHDEMYADHLRNGNVSKGNDTGDCKYNVSRNTRRSCIRVLYCYGDFT